MQRRNPFDIVEQAWYLGGSGCRNGIAGSDNGDIGAVPKFLRVGSFAALAEHGIAQRPVRHAGRLAAVSSDPIPLREKQNATG